MSRPRSVNCVREQDHIDDASIRSLIDLLSGVGARRPVNCPQSVLEGVAAYVERLRGQLADPSAVEQVTMLAMIADSLIIRERLNHALLSRGISRRNGETKQALNDFRQQTRLVLQMLKQLRFRQSAVPPDAAEDFRSQWEAGSARDASRSEADR